MEKRRIEPKYCSTFFFPLFSFDVCVCVFVSRPSFLVDQLVTRPVLVADRPVRKSLTYVEKEDG